MLIESLILFFIILLMYQIISSIIHSSKEGLECNNADYQNYNVNTDNALILAQQNAGNISVLKEQIETCNNLNTTVQELSSNLYTLQSQVIEMVNSQGTDAMPSLPETE